MEPGEDTFDLCILALESRFEAQFASSRKRLARKIYLAAFIQTIATVAGMWIILKYW